MFKQYEEDYLKYLGKWLCHLLACLSLKCDHNVNYVDGKKFFLLYRGLTYEVYFCFFIDFITFKEGCKKEEFPFKGQKNSNIVCELYYS